jgi:hypothetical protein
MVGGMLKPSYTLDCSFWHLRCATVGVVGGLCVAGHRMQPVETLHYEYRGALRLAQKRWNGSWTNRETAN